ncbi:hypothetical protein BC829DRAFT_416706 [Chytridium lagenaria]|nr:hypothetical protein BC829DRAFT_416706 [Chytridium lagenaria]
MSSPSKTTSTAATDEEAGNRFTLYIAAFFSLLALAMSIASAPLSWHNVITDIAIPGNGPFKPYTEFKIGCSTRSSLVRLIRFDMGLPKFVRIKIITIFSIIIAAMSFSVLAYLMRQFLRTG